MLFDPTNLSSLMPETFLFLTVIGFLLLGVFGGERMTRPLLYGVMFTLLFAGGMVIGMPGITQTAFDGLFVTGSFIEASKILILGGALLVLAISTGWFRKAGNARFEYPLLMLLSVLGMLVLVSSGNLLTLYMGLELTSLPLYVLAAINRDNLKSTEAGLKYFVLGSLASGMLLFGISLIYGFSGTLDFASIAQVLAQVTAQSEALAQPMAVSLGLLVGLLLVMVGFCFKISAVPFHMWTPDVYEGAPTPVTAFFAVAPKIAAITLLARLLMGTFGDLTAYWQQVVVFVSIASMFVGALGAIMQTNIKRLLAYSSIGHVGYALIGIASGIPAGAQALLIYLAIYLFMSVGAFGCVLLMRRKGEYVEDISELAGLAETRPAMAAGIAIFMLSMAGIPPLAGFFGKFYIFLAAVESGLYGLAVIGVIASVIAAYYYLKLIKLMYFDEARIPFDKEMPRSMKTVIAGCTAFTLLFFLYPTPLVTYAQASARALAGSW